MDYLHGWVGNILSGFVGALILIASGLLKELVKDVYPWVKFKLVPSSRPATLVERNYEPRGPLALRCSWVAEAKVTGAKAQGYKVYTDPKSKCRVYREAGATKEFLMVNAVNTVPLP